jgi:hypothetical protein
LGVNIKGGPFKGRMERMRMENMYTVYMCEKIMMNR